MRAYIHLHTRVHVRARTHARTHTHNYKHAYKHKHYYSKLYTLSQESFEKLFIGGDRTGMGGQNSKNYFQNIHLLNWALPLQI